jgi:hypothetical protein
MHDTPSPAHSVKIEYLLGSVVGECTKPKIAIREILTRFGSRAYGPGILLLAAIELLPFVSAIPGLFIVTASGIMLLAVQLLFGRQTPWLPAWFLNFSISRERLVKLDEVARPWAKWLDGLVKPRLEFFVAPPFLQAIAIACVALAISFFPLSPIPAAEKVPAFPIALFALAISARDGLMAILGFVLLAVSLGLLVYFSPSIVDACDQAFRMLGIS